MSEQKNLKVELIQHTPLPQELIALSAKLCYSKSSIDDLKDKISLKDQSAFIDRLMNMGHESILEHVTFTFGIEGVSLSMPAVVGKDGIETLVPIKLSVDELVRLQNSAAGLKEIYKEAMADVVTEEAHAYSEDE